MRVGRYETKLAERIRETVSAKPHVLIAYAWVMYMAVFSGGRWIRQQFDSAGSDYWTGILASSTVTSEKAGMSSSFPGYTFLSFAGDEDGEDIKADFKSRLAETEAQLTEEERVEVVEAAQELFDHCIQLVGEMDGRFERALAGRLAPLAVLLGLIVLVMAAIYWTDEFAGLWTDVGTL